MVAILLAERRLVFPLFQVFGRVNTHFLSHGKDEVPRLDVLVPERARVTEVCNIAGCQHGVACIFLERLATIL